MSELAVAPVRHGPFAGRLAPESIAAYTAATGDLLGLLGIEDTGRVARIAVRFASPTPLDSDLTVKAFGITEDSFAFEATARGVTTITHGRMELRS